MERNNKNTTIIGSPVNNEEIRNTSSFVKDMFSLATGSADAAAVGSLIGVPVQPQLSLFNAGVFGFVGVASAVGIGAVAAVKTIGKRIGGESGGVASMWWSEVKGLDSALHNSINNINAYSEKKVVPPINVGAIGDMRGDLDVSSPAVGKKNAL